jgi:hypothetical protein
VLGCPPLQQVTTEAPLDLGESDFGLICESHSHLRRIVEIGAGGKRPWQGKESSQWRIEEEHRGRRAQENGGEVAVEKMFYGLE